MADLNNTIVRGKLRVTEDINANGNITGSGITLSSVKNAKVVGTGANGLIEAHTLGISDITNLQTSLNGKTSKSDVSDIIESTLQKKNKIYVLSSLTSDENIYIDSGNRTFADKSAVIHLDMSEPSEAHAVNLYLVTGNEKKKVYPSELLLGDIIMTKDPEYPMRIITNIIPHTNNNSLLTSTTFTCTAVNSNDINDISQLKKDSEYFYQNSNSRVLTTSQDFGAKFGYVLLGTFNSSSRGSVNIHATYGDSQKRSAIEMNVSFNSSGTPTGYYTGTEANYDDGYCSLMTAPTERDTSKLGLYMRLRGNVTYTIVINMPTNKNGGLGEEPPFSIVNAYTMIYNDSSWDPAKASHWTTVNQSSMKSIGDDLLKITGSSGFGDTDWHYRKIGHFIFNSSDFRNGAPVHISGVIGSWAQEKMIFDIFVCTRGGLKVNGFVRGTNPSCRLVIDNTENPNIFLAIKGFATYNITVDTFKNAQNENGAVRGCFHIDWTGGDDFSGSDVGVTAPNLGYKDLLSMVAYRRAYYAYTGSFSETNGTMKQLCTVKGEETGKIICVHGKATSANSELSIQRKTSPYHDYDCIAVAPTGYSSNTYISCTGVVPPRLQYAVATDSSVESTYYIFGRNVSEVYVITFDLL